MKLFYSASRPCVLIALIFTSSMYAGLIVEENFEYAAGSLAKRNGGSGFDAAWTAPESDENVRVVNGGLSYQVAGGGLIDGGSQALRINGVIAEDTNESISKNLFNRSMKGFSGEEFFLRYLISAPEGSEFNLGRNAGFWLGSSNNWVYAFHTKDGGGWGARVGGSDTETIPPLLNKGETYLVVARFWKKDGAGGKFNRVDLWINPEAGDSENPQFKGVGRTTGLLHEIELIGFRVGAFAKPTNAVLVDALAAGESWSDVVPGATARAATH